MASAVEQLSNNISFSSMLKNKELKSRILFVLGALLVYRLGTYIPIPGINPLVWAEFFEQTGDGLLGQFNLFSGGAIERMTIFALNIMPYISASIIMQLASHMVPSLERTKKEGEVGRIKINQYTRYLTVLLATVQAYGLAVGVEKIQGATGSAVIDPGVFFRVSTIITIVGGTVFIMWLGEQITQRGIGNGISLIIFAGIVSEMPREIFQLLDLGREGRFNEATLLSIFALIVGTVLFIVFVERAQRRLVVQYPKRQVGNKMYAGQNSYMPLKINTAGVIPPIFASALLFLPVTVVGFSGGQGGDFVSTLSGYLQHGSYVYMALYGALITFFCFFYTAIVFNPEENADVLRRNGGFIPGIRPGKSTADYLDHIMTRLTVVGAAYMVFICLLPEVLTSQLGVPFYSILGTSLLIVVTVTIDTVAQIHSHQIAQQYEGVMKKSKLRGKR